VGNGIVTQIGGWIAYPFKNQIPWQQLAIAVLIIAILVWFLADGTQWVEVEIPSVTE
jgi:hypothetical protein